MDNKANAVNVKGNFPVVENGKFNLSAIMHEAKMIQSNYGFSWAEALRQTWKHAKHVKALRQGVTHFFFKKKNTEEVREAYGTLLPSYCARDLKGGERIPKATVQVYFDTERDKFRSYCINNLIEVR